MTLKVSIEEYDYDAIVDTLTDIVFAAEELHSRIDRPEEFDGDRWLNVIRDSAEELKGRFCI